MGLPSKLNLAVGRLVDAGDAVEGRGLAGAVGADEGHYLAAVDLQREVVDGDDAAELHGDVLHVQDVFNLFAHFAAPPSA